MASNPLFTIPYFFLHFSLEPSYGYLRFEGKFLWKGREYGGERNGHWIDILRYLFPLISLTGPWLGLHSANSIESHCQQQRILLFFYPCPNPYPYLSKGIFPFPSNLR